MKYFEYHLKYHMNHNLIISEEPIPYFPTKNIHFKGRNNVLFLKKGVQFHDDIDITFRGDESFVYLGDSKGRGHSYYFSLDVYSNSVVYFGGDTYFNSGGNPINIKVAEMANLMVGTSSLFSSGLNIETSDAHLLYDNVSGNLIRSNQGRDIILENHTWLGRNVSLNKGTFVKSGSVIGNNSVVTKKFTETNSVIVGVPAKKIKNNIFWRGNSTSNYTEGEIQTWSTYSPTEIEQHYDRDFEPYIAALDKSHNLVGKFAKNLLILEKLNKSEGLDFLDDEYQNYLKLFDFFSERFSENEVVVDISGEANIHELAVRQNDSAMKFEYRNFLANDFVFYKQENQLNYFIKRENYQPDSLDDESVEINERLRKFKNIFFRFEYLGARRTKREEKRMVVVFSEMPSDDEASNPDMTIRGGYPVFKNLKRSLLKDTFVLRIVDANLASGSFYLNTPNYPEFESEIQKIISVFASSYTIPKENIVMFGPSKGAFASLYHGLLGGYASVNSDPIIDDTIYAKDNRDPHFQEAFRELNLIPKINEMLENSDKRLKKYIIGNRHVRYTFKQYSELNLDNNGVILYDTDDDVDSEHPIILRSAIPQVLTMINTLLDEQLR